MSLHSTEQIIERTLQDLNDLKLPSIEELKSKNTSSKFEGLALPNLCDDGTPDDGTVSKGLKPRSLGKDNKVVSKGPGFCHSSGRNSTDVENSFGEARPVTAAQAFYGTHHDTFQRAEQISTALALIVAPEIIAARLPTLLGMSGQQAARLGRYIAARGASSMYLRAQRAAGLHAGTRTGTLFNNGGLQVVWEPTGRLASFTPHLPMPSGSASPMGLIKDHIGNIVDYATQHGSIELNYHTPHDKTRGFTALMIRRMQKLRAQGFEVDVREVTRHQGSRMETWAGSHRPSMYGAATDGPGYVVTVSRPGSIRAGSTTTAESTALRGTWDSAMNSFGTRFVTNTAIATGVSTVAAQEIIDGMKSPG